MDCDWKTDQRIYAGMSIVIVIILCVLPSEVSHGLMIINSCNVLAYRVSLPDPKMSLVACSLIEHYTYDKFEYFFISFCITSLRYSRTKMRSMSSCVVVRWLYNRRVNYRVASISRWLRGVISLLQHGYALIIGHKLLSSNMHAVMYGN